MFGKPEEQWLENPEVNMTCRELDLKDKILRGWAIYWSVLWGLWFGANMTGAVSVLVVSSGCPGRWPDISDQKPAPVSPSWGKTWDLLWSPSPGLLPLPALLCSLMLFLTFCLRWVKVCGPSLYLLLQGGDKKNPTTCLKCLWLPDVPWQAQSCWWGWDCMPVLDFGSWEDTRWTQHQN